LCLGPVDSHNIYLCEIIVSLCRAYAVAHTSNKPPPNPHAPVQRPPPSAVQHLICTNSLAWFDSLVFQSERRRWSFVLYMRMYIHGLVER